MVLLCRQEQRTAKNVVGVVSPSAFGRPEQSGELGVHVLPSGASASPSAKSKAGRVHVPKDVYSSTATFGAFATRRRLPSLFQSLRASVVLSVRQWDARIDSVALWLGRYYCWGKEAWGPSWSITARSDWQGPRVHARAVCMSVEQPTRRQDRTLTYAQSTRVRYNVA